MTATDDSYIRVYHSAEIDELIETLCEPGGASLVLESGGRDPMPVIIKAVSRSEGLFLDISAVPDIEITLRRGNGFRISGLGRQGAVRTPVLTASRCRMEDRRLYCECNYPLYVERLQRRDAYRAALRLDMAVEVCIESGGQAAEGRLRDLSLKGCRVDLDASAVDLISDHAEPLSVRLRFPDGTRFETRARPCHRQAENDRIVCGLEFDGDTADHQRQLWFLVREIERESARHAAGADANLRPSSLFTPAVGGAPPSRFEYATPLARRLARTAAFLETEVLNMRQGGRIDPARLSRHAERLLALCEEDREGVLFALACLYREPPLIRHCLAVAVRLVDMGASLAMPPEICKALAAAGMVHDLGKALLPESIRNAARLSAEQYSQVQNHVPLIQERLADCHWLSRAVIEAVVEGANERLDGSGYPHHRRAAGLHELSRLAATVDVVDAMGRARPDRDGLPIETVYQRLLAAPDQFDARWVNRYRDHFGAWPVGTLVRFAGGELGWVMALDREGRPARIRQADTVTRADITGGLILAGDEMDRLGEPRESVPVPREPVQN